MLHRFVLLPCTGVPTAVAAFQKRETGTTAGHATAGASNYTPEYREDDEATDDDYDYDRPSKIVSKALARGRGHELAIRRLHAITPTRE
jgi:hypothetical protein